MLALLAPCVAYFAVVREKQSASGLDGALHIGVVTFGDALITLAMVVGADIVQRVRLAVVPRVDFLVGDNLLTFRLFAVNLRHQPATRDYRVGFQEFYRTVAAHLRTDDARDVFFEGDVVD